MAKRLRSVGSSGTPERKSSHDHAFLERASLAVAGAIAGVAALRQSKAERQYVEMTADIEEAKSALAESRQIAADIRRLGHKVAVSAG